MCVTPGGKIGNCTCGMPNCCHIRTKKAAFFGPTIRAKSLFSLPLPTYLLDERSGVVRFGFWPLLATKIEFSYEAVQTVNLLPFHQRVSGSVRPMTDGNPVQLSWHRFNVENRSRQK